MIASSKAARTREINSVILARMGKNVRVIKNIVVFWFILFILGMVGFSTRIK